MKLINICNVPCGRYRTDSTGAFTGASGKHYGMSRYVPCVPGGTYIFLGWDTGAKTNSRFYIAWYREDGSYIRTDEQNRAVKNPLRWAVTAPENAGYAALTIYNADGIADGTRLDIRLGNTVPDAYEPPVTATPEKMILGMNPHRKAVDHGGFFDKKNGKPLYQNSPLSFLRSAREGIMYHNIDICFSSDGIPFVLHDDLWTDANGKTFRISETRADDVIRHRLGDAEYNWIPQTLEETNRYIRNLGGIIDMADISHPTPDKAVKLNAYYIAHNIRPTWTNMDTEACMDAFIRCGNGFGVYIICQDEWNSV